MSEIIDAIHHLHTGTEAKIGLFHCDIKPHNICLDQNYTVKLIDCGLAKFFPLDQSIDSSKYSFSVLNTSPASVFGAHAACDGTRGYTCPWYSKGFNKFEASCDVYSFGIVMIELVRGCLQNKQLENFSERYLPSHFEGNPAQALKLAIPELVRDVDPLAEEWEDGILSSVCELAISCIQYNRAKRPTTNELVEKLHQLVWPIEHKATDLISISQSKLKEAMENVNSRPIELPKEFITYCTNNFAVDRKLGQGAFGVVYKSQDDNWDFAVKCILFNIAVEKTKVEEVTKSFKRELQVSSFMVSNIAFHFKSLCFSFYYHTVSGIKEVPTPQYCNFVWLSFVL